MLLYLISIEGWIPSLKTVRVGNLLKEICLEVLLPIRKSTRLLVGVEFVCYMEMNAND